VWLRFRRFDIDFKGDSRTEFDIKPEWRIFSQNSAMLASKFACQRIEQ